MDLFSQQNSITAKLPPANHADERGWSNPIRDICEIRGDIRAQSYGCCSVLRIRAASRPFAVEFPFSFRVIRVFRGEKFG
jgi:hypothetical protein